MAETQDIQNFTPEEEAEVKRIVDSLDAELAAITKMRGEVSIIQADSTAADFTIKPSESLGKDEASYPQEETDEIVDITDMIEEVPEEAPSLVEVEPVPQFEEHEVYEEKQPQPETVSEEIEIAEFKEEAPAFEEEIISEPSKKEISPLEELEELTKFEPQTVEAHEIRTDEFITEEPQLPKDVV